MKGQEEREEEATPSSRLEDCSGVGNDGRPENGPLATDETGRKERKEGNGEEN
ncbi:hypothetical protein PF005_g22239 [Phytophthora fragariae]|uniref:Uncharacterized protein n=1 Tax=Phytophthora fragariae TaxID=53985 RepID=A0A6A3RP11_9STRA|nr:hypothetical protein PF003_g1761 [Phytophthora fragariae]KAE8925625.1 hypothetical protein PF009_g24169 [Phytophthora fragariae]KAE8981768.1 hypothetical protein PF011_g21897 [Phytophthora fragariae]KAE9079377.1 hypothetical protein PF010_g22774 [Phytophthora fragariae]KAE9101203.1 hypothetical protein PF006_g22725 [Phytophthora fragariae]